MTDVIFLTGEYPPMQGGVGDHTAHLAEHLIPLGVSPAVLTSHRWAEIANATESGQANSTAVPVHPEISGWGWRCWPAITNFLEAHSPQVLHIQYQAAAFDLGGWINWLPWQLKRRKHAMKVVTTFHDLRIPYIFPKAGPLRWKSVLALARYSDAVICTNREDLSQLADIFSRSETPRPAHLTLIPLGSNVEPQPPPDFDRAAWRVRYQAGEETLLLAYFGFLNESKGGEELVKALVLLRQLGIDARLLLIGGDVGHADATNVSYAQQVQSLIDQYELGPFVHRTGFVQMPEVSANLLAADAVVLPYRDGVSFRRTTLIAALRHGCPVVSTEPDDPALIPEIVTGENMLLVPSENAAALAKAIAPLAANRPLCRQLSEGAKALGDLFEWHKIASDTAALYQMITQPPGKRPRKPK